MRIVRSVLILILLHLYFFTFSQDFEIYRVNDLYGLKDADGTVVLLPEFEKLGWADDTELVHNGVIGYRKNGFWGIVNTKGKVITSPLYKDLTYSAGYLVSSVPGKLSRKPLYGLLDTRGRIVTSFRYENIVHALADQFIVSEFVDGRSRTGVMIPDKKLVLAISYQHVSPLRPDQYLIRTYNGLYGIADIEGKIVIPAIYESICLTEDNLYRVSRKGFTGEIDRSGAITTEVKAKSVTDNRLIRFSKWSVRNRDNAILESIMADSVSSVGNDRYVIYRNDKTIIFSSQLADTDKFDGDVITNITDQAVIVRSNKGVEVKKPDGSSLITESLDSVYFDGQYYYAQLKGNKGWFLYSKTGSKLSAKPADRLVADGTDRIRYLKGDYWGVMDFDGSVLANAKYDTIMPFDESGAIVRKLGLWGMLDRQNQWAILPYENNLRKIADALYVSKKGYHIRFYDLKGNPLRSITTDYRLIDGYIVVKGEYGKEGVMDYNGDILLPVVYDSISRLSDSRFFKVEIDSLSGVTDSDDRVIVPLSDRLGEVVGYSEGFIGLQLDNKYGFVNDDGLLLIANRYDSVRLFSDGLAAYKLNGKWGFLDRKEKLIIQPVYTEVLPFRNGITAARDGNKWGLINKEGRMLEPFRYNKITRQPDGKYLLTGSNGLGLADQNGQLIFQPVYDQLTDLENETAIVSKNGKFGVLTYRGDYVIPTLYSRIIYDKRQSVFLVKEN